MKRSHTELKALARDAVSALSPREDDPARHLRDVCAQSQVHGKQRAEVRREYWKELQRREG